MKQISSVLLAICLVLPLGVWASPIPFGSASSDVREYIVLSLAEFVREKSTIVIFKEKVDGNLVEKDFPWYYAWELGLNKYRCLDVLKGCKALSNFPSVFLYDTPRENFEFVRVYGTYIDCGECLVL